MSALTESFAQARAVLEVPVDSDKAAIKRAYRRKTLLHPPDRDPQGFQKIREAYEVLANPLASAQTRLSYTMPHVMPPSLPEPSPPTEPLVLGVLRHIVASLPVEELERHRSAVKLRRTKPT